jgi:hypothetical protein
MEKLVSYGSPKKTASLAVTAPILTSNVAVSLQPRKICPGNSRSVNIPQGLVYFWTPPNSLKEIGGRAQIERLKFKENRYVAIFPQKGENHKRVKNETPERHSS